MRNDIDDMKSMIEALDNLRASMEYISEKWSDNADVERVMNRTEFDEYPFDASMDEMSERVNLWVMRLFNEFRQEVLVHSILDGLHRAEKMLNSMTYSCMFQVENDDLKSALVRAREELNERNEEE